ncbi:DUF5789 family protein [Candidatus Halobonum tyrrellensis]|uniref:Uncharacterized protein n=1 Tax=Candidatus Halobonum tyrrellensis G22 TaxID=1324957 RepID=V4GV53_9EURY|nr:hypothetical protein [Candidatus Halobonum tyrrellensis]ESP89026.1 hypothetical protein K933_06238 [Candidatus Halobonum tyrrellensis G22]
MGVRPPQNDSSEPDAVAFGIAALDERLDRSGVQFPATTDEVLAAVDDTSVPYDAGGGTLDLESALERVPADRFETETEFLNALHPVFEEHRERGAGSLVSRLRNLFPL